MFKKLLLSIFSGLVIFSLASVCSADNSSQDNHSVQIRKNSGYGAEICPTDVFVYNHINKIDSADTTISVSVGNVSAPRVQLYPSEYVEYYNTRYPINLQIQIASGYGLMFFDQYVGNHARVDVYSDANHKPQVRVS